MNQARRSNATLYIIICFCVVVQALAGLWIARNNQAEKDLEKRAKATEGQLKPENEIIQSPTATSAIDKDILLSPEQINVADSVGLAPDASNVKYQVWFGSIGAGWTKEQLEQEVPINQLIGVQGKTPLFVRLQDGMLVVSAKFYDLENHLVAELKNGNWTTNPGSVYKRNYDDHAIEVIDNTGMVVLKLHFESSLVIRIEGVIVTPQYVLIGTTEGLRTIPNLAGMAVEEEKFVQRRGMTWQNYVRDIATAIHPMFRYEGIDWIGKRAKAHS